MAGNFARPFTCMKQQNDHFPARDFASGITIKAHILFFACHDKTAATACSPFPVKRRTLPLNYSYSNE